MSAIIGRDGFPSSSVCVWEDILRLCASKSQPWKQTVWGWLRKQAASTKDEPACSRLWGGWDAGTEGPAGLGHILCTVMERLNVQQVLGCLSAARTWVFTKNKCLMITAIILAFTKGVVRMPSGKVKPAKITK